MLTQPDQDGLTKTYCLAIQAKILIRIRGGAALTPSI